jgi:tRNA-binding EMAP/Myf-like protein
MISYEEFKKVEIRAGKILSAEKVPDTDKLLKLSVDFGEFEEVPKIESADSAVPVGSDEVPITVSPTASPIVPLEFPQPKSKPRQIVSGISGYFPDPAVLVGKTCMFVTNLEPRTIKGLESNGMLFAVSTKEGGFSLLEPNNTITPGSMAA